MSSHLPMTALPSWAFAAIAKGDISVLMDRCEFETIVMTRQGRPDLVLVSHAEWLKLTSSRLPHAKNETAANVDGEVGTEFSNGL
jgi:hypothetical protein